MQAILTRRVKFIIWLMALVNLIIYMLLCSGVREALSRSIHLSSESVSKSEFSSHLY